METLIAVCKNNNISRDDIFRIRIQALTLLCKIPKKERYAITNYHRICAFVIAAKMHSDELMEVAIYRHFTFSTSKKLQQTERHLLSLLDYNALVTAKEYIHMTKNVLQYAS